MQDFEIIIVGAGPSGCATALELTNLDPKLANRILLLDKAIFPRVKLCAGGVINDADAVLRQLGVQVDLPASPVHTSKFILPTGCLTFSHPDHFRVIDRKEFDNLLFHNARRRGVVTKDGEELKAITRTSQALIVKTSKNEYRTKIIIGADGSNSSVRSLFNFRRSARLMIAIEIFVPLSQTNIPDFSPNLAIFDLSVTSRAVPGYCWVFPTVREGPPSVSLGIMAAPLRKHETLQLKTSFEDWLKGKGVEPHQFEQKSHPILRYEPRAPVSQERVLLTGDAAGVDPLFGEGISSALALGTLAAASALDAIKTNDFSFSTYESQIRSSSIGKTMRRRRFLARRLYTHPLLASRYLKYGSLLRWVTFLHAHGSTANISWQPSKEV
ncbi:MAG TPA: geranylgeranyl reductase family protein [Pyrinomonadaceae bacterium]|nr:geranylgeranyl reductase family protein [Pyrinomonadaceae bacterium]